LYVVFKQFLDNTEDVLEYGNTPAASFAFEQIGRRAVRITKDKAGPGDIVQMNYGGRSVHFGILTDRGIIHANTKTRNVTEHSVDAVIAEGRIVAYYRLKGIPAWRN